MSRFRRLLRFNKSSSRSRLHVTATEQDEAEIESYGLFLLKDSSAVANNADIIAVHGLGGHWMNTWMGDDNNHWLRDSVPSKLQDRAVTDITDEAAMMLDRIKGERKTREERTGPVIFVAHSLGGILVKKAMILANERHVEYAEFLSAIKCTMFFGTPHRGSDSAYWAAFAANAIRAAQLGLGTNTAFITALQRNSMEFANISQQWVERTAQLRIRTFFETERLLGVLVVDKDSARLGLVNEVAVGVAGADHRTICKFSNFKSQKYRPVLNAMEELAQQAVGTGARRILEISLTDNDTTALQALYITDYEAHRHRNLVPEAETCQWVFDHPQYRDWLSRDQSSLLWISADPGCGKSVLASYLVEQFRQSSDRSRTICHFFFKDDNDTQRRAESALCSILHQLLSLNRHLVKHLTKEFWRKGKRIGEDLYDLWGIFLDAVNEESCGTVLLVLDGLDECEPDSRQQLLQLLTSFYQSDSNTGFLMTVVSSRPYQPIRDAFQDAPTIRLKTEEHLDAIDADVRRVVNGRMQRFARRMGIGNDTNLEKLRQGLLSKVDSTFLWVTLILDMFESNSCLSWDELFMIIETSNPELDSLYERILAQTKHQAKACKIFQIMLAARQPLTLEQMDIACAIQGGNKTVKDMELHRFLSMEDGIRDTCGLFVRVIDGCISFVHQTAREFLLVHQNPIETIDTLTTRTGGFQSPTVTSSWRHSFHKIECDLVMADICMAYLLLEDLRGQYSSFERTSGTFWSDYSSWEFRSAADKLVSNNPFLEYASIHWTSYLSNLEETTTTHHKENASSSLPTTYHHESALSLLSDSCHLAVWMPIFIRSAVARRRNYKDQFKFDVPPTVLGLASYFGLYSVVHQIAPRPPELDTLDTNGYTPLFYAALSGNLNLVSLLLQFGASVGGSSSKEQTFSPLTASVTAGDFAITELLLTTGADVNKKNLSGATALFSATDAKVITLLLDHGASYEISDCDGLKAYQVSIATGSLSLLEVLLNKDISVHDLGGPRLLRYAVVNGNVQAIDLLLRHAPILVAPHNFSISDSLLASTPKFITEGATLGGRADMVETLLRHGAQVDQTDHLERTALHIAAGNLDLKFVNLLIQYGAIASALYERSCSPLHFLAEKSISANDEEEAVLVVAALLNAGADIDARDREGNTPLHLSIKGSNSIYLIEYLLSQGADIEATNLEGHGIFDILNATFAGNFIFAGSFTVDEGITMRKDIIDVLVEYGLQLEARDATGSTLLMRAVRSGTAWLVKALLEAGADHSAKDPSGRTALESFQLEPRTSLGHSEVHILLRDVEQRGNTLQVPDVAQFQHPKNRRLYLSKSDYTGF